jgi:hypothetical protein
MSIKNNIFWSEWEREVKVTIRPMIIITQTLIYIYLYLYLQLKQTDCQRLPGSTKITLRSMPTRRRKGNFDKPRPSPRRQTITQNPTRAWKERAKSRGIALQSRGRTRPTLHTRPTEASHDHCCLTHQQMPQLIRKRVAFLLSLTSITTFFSPQDHTN